MGAVDGCVGQGCVCCGADEAKVVAAWGFVFEGDAEDGFVEDFLADGVLEKGVLRGGFIVGFYGVEAAEG